MDDEYKYSPSLKKFRKQYNTFDTNTIYQDLKTDFHNFDLIVVGAGSAGVAAACSAARQGAKVALLEKKSFAGGRATDAFVGTICGLYFRNEVDEFSYSSEGFMLEFAERLKKASNSSPLRTQNGIKFLPYKHPAFVFLCDEMLAESGVQMFYHYSVIGVAHEVGKILGLTVFCQNKTLFLSAKAFVDASGTALIQTLTGKEPIRDMEYQQSHFSVQLSGIIASKFEDLKVSLIYALKVAEKKGIILPALAYTSIIPGQASSDTIWLKIPVSQKYTETFQNKLSNTSPIEQEARHNAQIVLKCLKEFAPDFKNTYISQLAYETGTRITERNAGRLILSKEDVLNCKKHSTSSIKATWPIETWKLGEKVQMEYFLENDFYSIPNETMTSLYFDNLFFAGRNISADTGAIASARVIGTCLQMGESVSNTAKIHF